jgi:hypothetical protein
MPSEVEAAALDFVEDGGALWCRVGEGSLGRRQWQALPVAPAAPSEGHLTCIVLCHGSATRRSGLRDSARRSPIKSVRDIPCP